MQHVAVARVGEPHVVGVDAPVRRHPTARLPIVGHLRHPEQPRQGGATDRSSSSHESRRSTGSISACTYSVAAVTSPMDACPCVCSQPPKTSVATVGQIAHLGGREPHRPQEERVALRLEGLLDVGVDAVQPALLQAERLDRPGPSAVSARLALIAAYDADSRR